MDGKVHLKCGYTYEDDGTEKSDTYISPKFSQNVVDPVKITEILTDEIKNETGRIVKDFMFVGKEPIKH